MTRIDGYRFGRVVVDGEEQSRDVIVLPSRVVRNWWREEGHVLGLPDLDDVLEELPERLILGTGATARCGRIPTQSTRCTGAGSMSRSLAPTRPSGCSRRPIPPRPPPRCT